MDCLISDSLTCIRCGRPVRARNIRRNCGEHPPAGDAGGSPAFVMVGDAIERGLSAVGITKPLVERITRTAGKPGGCGCQQRQQWLNEAGVAVQKQAAAWTDKARRFYFGS